MRFEPSKFGRSFSVFVLVSVFFLLFFFWINPLFNYLLRDSRQIKVSAVTDRIQLQIDINKIAKPNIIWRLSGPLSIFVNQQEYPIAGPIRVHFDKGGTIAVEKKNSDKFKLVVLEGLVSDILESEELGNLPPIETHRDYLEFSQNQSFSNGMLEFNASVQVGAPPISGYKTVLKKGEYAIAETLPMRVFGPDGPVIYREGALAHGDVVKIINVDGCDNDHDNEDHFVQSYGYFTILDGEIFVNTVSELTDSALLISRPGEFSSCVTPRWFDIAIKDPFLIATVSLLALCLATIELYAKLLKIVRHKFD